MKLPELLAAHIERDPHLQARLRGIPPAVVREVCEMAVEVLADWLIPTLEPDALTGDFFEKCEGCDNILDGETCKRDVDRVPLCDLCFEELRDEARGEEVLP